MPHRPEDTSIEPVHPPRPGETPDEAVEGSRREGPRIGADTQPPAPAGRRPMPGHVPSHGERL